MESKLLLPLRQERFGPGSIYCYILNVGFFNVHAIADIDYKTGNGLEAVTSYRSQLLAD